MKHNRGELLERGDAPRELREGDKVIVIATQEQLDRMGYTGNFSKSRGIVTQKGKHCSCVSFPGRQERVLMFNSYLEVCND